MRVLKGSIVVVATLASGNNTIKDAMEELTVDNFYGPYDLILQPSAFLDAHTFIGNTAVIQTDKIRELIGGKVYVTPALKALTVEQTARC